MPAEHHSQLIRLLGVGLRIPRPLLEAPDWEAIQRSAAASRVLPLLYASLREQPGVPESILQALRRESQRSFVATVLTAQALRSIDSALSEIPWVLLRGPVLGQLIYGDLMLRPYGDLDVLVPRDQVDSALDRLKAAGFEPPASALPAAYYRRYHLHIDLSKPGLAGKTVLELHWALDHPFTLLTLDPDEMIDRRTSVAIDGHPIPCLALEDLLIALAIHAVKHAAPLHYWIEQGTPDALAAHGMLLHFYDIALAVKRFGDALDWKAIEERAERAGASASVSLCLRAVDLLWPGVVLREHLAQLSLGSVSRWEKPVFQLITRTDSAVESRPAFRQLRGLFFRPIRLIDTVRYITPPADYLTRRYGGSDFKRRIDHTLRAILALAGGAFSLIFYQAGQLARRAAKPRSAEQPKPDAGT